MPRLTYNIPDIYEMVTRPVAVSVIRSIISVTGMPDDTFIEYAGENDGIPSYRTTLGKQPFDITDTAKFNFYGKVKVDYAEEPEPNTILNSAYQFPDNQILFSDPNLGILLTDYREKVNARLNFVYRTRDKNEAENWRTNMRKKMKLHFIDESFKASFDYVLPYTLFGFFTKFHEMRENVAPFNEDFKTWFKEHVKRDYSVKVNLAEKHPQFVFREEQFDILGNFEFDAPPQEERIDGGSSYEIQFSFRFSYDKPIGYFMQYPLVIHNQLLPKKFRSSTGWYDAQEKIGGGSRSTVRYKDLFKDDIWNKDINRGHLIPDYDDWMPKTVTADTTNFVQFLVAVDPDQPTKLLDLLNLDKMAFDPLLIKYMKETQLYLNKRSGSWVNISVYVNDRMMDPRNFYIDGDLVIWSKTELNLRDRFHIRIGLFTELFVLQPFASKLLRTNPDYFKMVLTGLDPDYEKKYALPKPVGGKLITKLDYVDAARNLTITARRHYSAEYRYILMPTQLNGLLINKS